MIAARLHDDQGGITLILVLEPGNIEKLKGGKPIHKFLNEFIPDLPKKVELLLCYTPDAAWVSEQMKHCPEDGTRLAEILEQSLSRKPIVIRDRSAEDMRKMQ